MEESSNDNGRSKDKITTDECPLIFYDSADLRRRLTRVADFFDGNSEQRRFAIVNARKLAEDIRMLMKFIPDPIKEQDVNKIISFNYRNWRGEIGIRHVIPIGLEFKSTEWHPEEQWLMEAYDIHKGENRFFAIADMDMYGTVLPSEQTIAELLYNRHPATMGFFFWAAPIPFDTATASARKEALSAWEDARSLLELFSKKKGDGR